MSETPIAPESPSKHWWNLTLVEILEKLRWNPSLIEILWILLIAVILAFLLIPEVEYVADGERELPVRVFVFDVDSGEPIRGADVAVYSARGLYRIEDCAERAKDFTGLMDYVKTMPADKKGQTDEHGLITLQEVFRSGSSNKHPNTRVFPARCWVIVTAANFSGVVVSLGREDVEYGEVKRGGGFLVPIGIMRDPGLAK